MSLANNGVVRGLIPAHAGKTRPRSRRYGTSRAHPRSRGENKTGMGTNVVGAGSSPLTRGKLRRLRCHTFHRRLIPAHAGKTEDRGFTGHAMWAHPRSRGENPVCAVIRIAWLGSPPLTRGKPVAVVVEAVPRGLIPAHAGKTPPISTHTRSLGLIPAHAGENLPLSWEPPMLVGSSPLTRGKHVECEQIPRLQGLIPAHAGKTHREWHPRAGSKAHPHSRGENAGRTVDVLVAPGSSPLTRGKLIPVQGRFLVERLIPAHAGKTHQATCPVPDTRAHPRSCRENTS